MGYPNQAIYSTFGDLKTAFNALRPMMLNGGGRYLMLEGPDKSYCVYSNREFGGTVMGRPCAYQLGCDALDIYSAHPVEFYGKHSFVKALQVDPLMIPAQMFILDVIKQKKGTRPFRSVRFQHTLDGDVVYDSSGELLPFEKKGDFDCLTKGELPDRALLRKFIEDFGWPEPRSTEFPKHVKKIELYAFPDMCPDTRLPESAERELLALPEEWGL